jgi:predicted transposase YbfD/YdcC
MKGTCNPLKSFILEFSEIEDPRIDRHKQWSLIEIMFLTVAATMSDCDTWEDIVDFGEMKHEWLRKYLPYEHGIPSHDTVNRVMSLIPTATIEGAFIKWATMQIELSNGTVIHFDGKSLCGSAGKTEQQIPKNKGGKSAKHILHAWCGELKVCIGQMEVPDKTNEITAIPLLLDQLEAAIDITGTIITIDAMGCQKAITAKIVEKGADFVIGVKDNQPRLRQSIEDVFSRASAENQAASSSYESEKGHSRKEQRFCTILSAKELTEEISNEWPDVKFIVRVDTIRGLAGKNEDETDQRFYISSLECTAVKMSTYVRGHWGMENQLHWQLDYTFREDLSKKQIRNAAQNYSTMIKTGLNLININTTEKRSMRGKRKKCAMSDEYREKCFGF